MARRCRSSSRGSTRSQVRVFHIRKHGDDPDCFDVSRCSAIVQATHPPQYQRQRRVGGRNQGSEDQLRSPDARWRQVLARRRTGILGAAYYQPKWRSLLMLVEDRLLRGGTATCPGRRLPLTTLSVHRLVLLSVTWLSDFLPFSRSPRCLSS